MIPGLRGSADLFGRCTCKVRGNERIQPRALWEPSVKKTDLDKHQGKKIIGRMKQEVTPGRYGATSGGIADRKEQRKRDQAAGLVPFAVKLPQDLVAQLQALALKRDLSLDTLVAGLLQDAVT